MAENSFAEEYLRKYGGGMLADQEEDPLAPEAPTTPGEASRFAQEYLQKYGGGQGAQGGPMFPDRPRQAQQQQQLQQPVEEAAQPILSRQTGKDMLKSVGESLNVVSGRPWAKMRSGLGSLLEAAGQQRKETRAWITQKLDQAGIRNPGTRRLVEMVVSGIEDPEKDIQFGSAMQEVSAEQLAPEQADVQRIQKLPLYHPSRVAMAFENSTAYMATVAAATAATGNPAAGVAAAWAFSSGDAIEEYRDKVDPKTGKKVFSNAEALSRAIKVGGAVALLESAVPIRLTKALQGNKVGLRFILGTAGIEGSTEFFQEVVQIGGGVDGVGNLKDVLTSAESLSRMGEASFYGALIGGGFAGGTTLANVAIGAVDEKIKRGDLSPSTMETPEGQLAMVRYLLQLPAAAREKFLNNPSRETWKEITGSNRISLEQRQLYARWLSELVTDPQAVSALMSEVNEKYKVAQPVEEPLVGGPIEALSPEEQAPAPAEAPAQGEAGEQAQLPPVAVLPPPAEAQEQAPPVDVADIFDAEKGIGAVPDNAEVGYKGFIVQGTPRQFLTMVPPGVSSHASEGRIRGALRRGEKIAPPFIQAEWDDKNKQWKIVDHEGRSRMLAVGEEFGQQPVPIHVFPRGGLRARDITPEMRAAPFVPQKGGRARAFATQEQQTGAPPAQAPDAAQEPGQPHSPEALAEAFDVPMEQAEAMAAILQAAGLDSSKVRVVRGGKPGEKAYLQHVFHGTPHKFEPEPGFPHGRFRLDKIGTGEGAQAYGWGIYVAESRGVAKSYAGETRETFDEVEPIKAALHDMAVSWPTRDMSRGQQDDMYEAIWERFSEREPELAEVLAEYTGSEGDARDYGVELLNVFGGYYDAKHGTIYKLDIPDDVVPKLLAWDKPLEEQTPGVRDTLTRSEYAGMFGEQLTTQGKPTGRGATGEQIYRSLQNELGSDRAASEFLGRAGIPGLKFLDGVSRTKGEGTHNHVIWDQAVLDRIALLERNGERLDAMRALEQKRQGQALGAAELTAAGDALLRGFEGSDVSTGAHEIAHAIRMLLLNRDVAPEAREGITDEDIDIAERWAGVKDGKWDTKAEEKFARGFERYLRDGKAPHAKLKAVFEKFRTWLTQIYQRLKGSPINVKISPEMRAVFDKVLSRDAAESPPQPEAPDAETTAPASKEFGALPSIFDKDDRSRIAFDLPGAPPIEGSTPIVVEHTSTRKWLDRFMGEGVDATRPPPDSRLGRLTVQDDGSVRQAPIDEAGLFVAPPGTLTAKESVVIVTPARDVKITPEAQGLGYDTGIKGLYGAEDALLEKVVPPEDVAGIKVYDRAEQTWKWIPNPKSPYADAFTVDRGGNLKTAAPAVAPEPAVPQEAPSDADQAAPDAEPRPQQRRPYADFVSSLSSLKSEDRTNRQLRDDVQKVVDAHEAGVIDRRERDELLDDYVANLGSDEMADDFVSAFGGRPGGREKVRAVAGMYVVEPKPRVPSDAVQVVPEAEARQPSEAAGKALGWLDQVEQEVREDIRYLRGGGTLGANKPLGLAADYALIGAIKIAKGVVTFADWAAEMVVEFGDDVKPHLNELWAISMRLAAMKRADAANVKSAAVVGTQNIAKSFGPRNLSLVASQENVRRMFANIDAARQAVGEPQPETVAQWDDAADAIIAAKGITAYNDVIAGAFDASDPVQARMAMKAIAKYGDKDLASDNLEAITRAVTAGYNWRRSGTSLARAMRARRDPKNTPQERLQELITNLLVAPSERDIRIIQKGNDKAAQKAAVRQAKKLKKLIAQIRKDFGIDITKIPDDVLMDERKLSALIRDISAAKSSFGDMEREFWRNMILGAPSTQMANFVGNTGNSLYQYLLLEPIKAALNAFTGNRLKAATQLGDLPALFGGIFESATWKKANSNAVEAFITERPVTGEGLKIETGGVAIPGKAGRAIRLPQRTLLAADEYAKTVITLVEVGTQAEFLAREAGLSGQEKTQFIAEQVSDPTSSAWEAALEKAKRISFQQDVGPFMRKIMQLRDVGGFSGFVAYKVLPFVVTPTNIFKVGLRRTPLGLLPTVLAANKARKGLISQDVALEMAAEQVIAFALTAVLARMIFGGEDDENGIPMPLITGSMPDWRKRGQREYLYRTQYPQSIRVLGRYVSYSRLEPFATQLAAIVDLMSGDEPIGPRTYKALTGLVRDKTFTRGVGDLLDLFEGETKRLDKYLVRQASSYMSNFVRSSLRSMDDNIRNFFIDDPDAHWADMAERIGEQALPHPALLPPPKRDIFGRAIKRQAPTGYKTGDFFFRLLSPIAVHKPDPVQNLDRFIFNWNRDHPDDKFFPAIPNRAKWEDGTWFTKEEFSEFLIRRGERVLDYSRSITEDQIAKPSVEVRKWLGNRFRAESRTVKATMERERRARQTK